MGRRRQRLRVGDVDGEGMAVDLLGDLSGTVAVDVDVVRRSVSIGVALSTDIDDLDRLLGRADDALYEAKKSGRNRVARA